MLFLIAGATTKKSLITTQKASSRATLNVSSTKVSINSLNRMCRMFPVASQYCKTSFSFSDSTVGGWFLPGQTPICPSSSPPQFSGTAGHSSGSYCERYSSLRSHRAAPYPSHYSHRTSSTSKSPDMYIYTQQQKKVGELILKLRSLLSVSRQLHGQHFRDSACSRQLVCSTDPQLHRHGHSVPQHQLHI